MSSLTLPFVFHSYSLTPKFLYIPNLYALEILIFFYLTKQAGMLVPSLFVQIKKLSFSSPSTEFNDVGSAGLCLVLLIVENIFQQV